MTRTPAHRRPRDPLRGAQIAPAHTTWPAVVCAGCDHPRLIHRDERQCLRDGCGCPAYEEVPSCPA